MVTRKPAVAGTFYPGNPHDLKAEIQTYLNDATTSSGDLPVGFIVPHAGYIYSGPVAACAYKHILDRAFEKVVILAPSHFDAFEGLSIYPGDALETPLGPIEISAEDRDRLTGLQGVQSSELGFRQEHSLEVQLPFLQHLLKPGWKVVPIVMGYQHREVTDLAAQIVKDYLTGSVLVIISSDLSHYHPYNVAKEIDGRLCSFIREWNLEGLWRAQSSQQVEACGFGPIFAFLTALDDRTDVNVQVLDYRNSGDTAGTKDHVVGYCAVGAFSK